MITIFRGIDLDTNNALYRITALDKNGTLVMPSLEVTNKYLPEKTEFWDNEDYLFGELYNSLKDYSKGIEVPEHLMKEITEVIVEEDFPEVLELLETALVQGYYK